MSYSAVATFKIVNGEWVFNKLLKHLRLNEKEFRQQYGEKLSRDPTCLNDVIVKMMVTNIRRNKK